MFIVLVWSPKIKYTGLSSETLNKGSLLTKPRHPLLDVSDEYAGVLPPSTKSNLDTFSDWGNN